MVLMVLHKYYTGFPNVRIALVPQDDGEPGELRLNIVGMLQHKIYNPKTEHTYTYIPIGDIDCNQTDIIGCDAQIITFKDYEYWFRFPSDADATIFYRVLCYKMDLFDEGEYEEDEADYWEEGPWTISEVDWRHLECRCDCHGHIRYARDYSL